MTAFVDYQDERYCYTGKVGVHVKTGELMAEYESVEDNGKRIWVGSITGAILED